MSISWFYVGDSANRSFTTKATVNTQIDSLYLKGFRQFSELSVKFNSRFNFIAGPNGCGKTSILAGVGHCFTTSFEYSRFDEDTQFWTDLTINDIRYRVGSGAGLSLEKGYRSSNLTRWGTAPTGDDRLPVPIHQVKELIGPNVPLFIGAQRNITYQRIAGLTRESSIEDSITTYIGKAVTSLYGEGRSDTKQWLINRYFIIDKDWAIEERENWNHLITQLPHLGPFDSEFKYIRTGRDLEPVFSIYGNECYLEEISSGFQAVLLIVTQIIEWIERSRPEGSRSVKAATGTVLIDELDLHLHPEWQLTIRDGLSRLFPKLQFIVTTHSPHLLASAQMNEVIIMPGKAFSISKCSLGPSARSFSGWTTDQILSEVMGVKSLDNKIYERLVADALAAVENKKSDQLRETLEKLRAVSHPDNTILIVLTARLAALEAIDHD
jgi:hypothetical protein